MTLNVKSLTIHLHGTGHAALAVLNRKLERIMSTQTELAAQLTAINATLTKIGGETQSLLAKIQELADALDQAGETTPEVDAALAALTAQADAVDALVADLPVTPDPVIPDPVTPDPIVPDPITP